MFFRRTQGQRVPTPRRSISDTIRLKWCLAFSKPSSPALPYPSPRRIQDIGRPRQLRRVRQYPDYTAYAHFIHRLPVEVVALIFLSGSEDDVFFPVTASHVCRAWRQIALQTPALWRRINLSPKERMWKERIRRARACSLDIQLLPVKSRSRVVKPKPADLDPYSIQWHMHMVLPHIDRWRSLEIVFPEFGPYLWKASLSRCCSRTGAQAPLIEDLRLVYRANEDPEEFTLFSGSAPRLRSAMLDGIRLNWLPSLFANLTYMDYTHHGFTAGHQAVQDVVRMLKVSSQLVDLKLTFPRKPVICPPSSQEPTGKDVLLPKLKSLELRVEGKDIPYELARIATLVVTPSLTSLRLVDLGRSYHSFASLKSFFYIYALPPSLCSVRIEHGWYDPRMVTPIAQSHSKIRQIVIKRPHLPEQVINIRPAPRPRKATHSSGADWKTRTLSNRHLNNSHTKPFQIQCLDVQYFRP